MKNPLFNHDRFNTWQSCHKKYYFKYIKELKFPEFHQDYELGTSVHALIDYNLRGLEVKNLLENADKDIKNNWNSIKNHPIMEKKLIKTEWSFTTAVPNTDCWLIGRIDAIFFDEEKGKYIIADWKTGKYGVPKNINKDFQHKIYLYALYKSRKDLGLNFKPEELCFQYFKISPDGVEPTEIKFSEESMREYEEKFVSIIRRIENTTNFWEAESCKASLCQYKTLCLK